jgi:hypothetical protein
MWVALAVVLILVVASGWYFLSKNTTNSNNTNQVAVLNANSNQAQYTNGPFSDSGLGVKITTPVSWKSGKTVGGTVYFANDISYLDFYVRNETSITLPKEGFKA